MSDQPLFWSDQLAFGVTRKFEDQEEYVVASGISPSGIVHAGNFREIITTDFVAKSLKERGEKVRFIYSWDDYDRFRKVPSNVPDEWEQYLGLPLSDVPDPEGCHDSYAGHFEAQLEEELEDLHIEAEFIRQNQMFKASKYAELIKKAMNSRETIREILDKYRKEPLEDGWWPLRVYCTECGKDYTEIEDYDGEYRIEYYCKECEEDQTVDFKENDSVKPSWRIDWPMRWHYEGVDFEPAGKEHSAAGGSRDTANEIVREVYGDEPPVHQMYEFVTKDGAKISSSSGEDVFTISELKKIYTPGMIRFLFSNTKPNKAFEIPFESEEVFQRYDKFDTIEETYYNPDNLENEKKREHWKRVYEMAMVEVPETQPVRVPFQHASFIAQTVPEDEWEGKAIESLKRTGHVPEDIDEEGIEQVLTRLEKAKTWARDYAPDEYVYKINKELPAEIIEDLTEDEKEAVTLLAEKLEEAEFDQDELDGEIFNVRDESALDTGEFFTACYKVLIGRDQGPRLSRLILSIGQDQSRKILEQAN
ncbi:lysine--tRNA ligase [Candidatus Nanohalococcus occultus]|uniref:Lysine--tRNA ligase n=1 Tax=Candidatus Nanohalococcus occultus TaxID=2978047 RepID=A0ABY8CG93_9ARCH|nr:Lysyl-tRNA synthetase, class I [Candidatus Nanohaloarchaeota archaeon SVXNc]